MIRRKTADALTEGAAPGPRREEELYQQMRRSRAKLVGADGRGQKLPRSLSEFLLRLVRHLEEGSPVAIVQNDAQLTSVEGARMLGVSRQFLIQVLERGEIAYHMVGTHRRIYVRDLLAYKARRDSNRRRVLDDLTRAESEAGLYDLEPARDVAE